MAKSDPVISTASVVFRFLKLIATRPGFFKTLKLIAKTDPGMVLSLGTCLEDWARRTPDAMAIRFGDQKWTYAEFNRMANQYADFLKQRGVGFQDTVGVNLSNRPELLFVLAALAKLGAVAALFNTVQRGEVLEHSLGLAKANLLVVGAEQVANMAAVGNLIDGPYAGKMLWLPDGETDLVPPGYEDMAAAAASCSDANLPESRSVTLRERAYLVFTSGTTGYPKASIMSWARWYKSALAFGQINLGLSPADTIYCCLPLYHNNALVSNFGPAIYAGATFALSRKFSASRFWSEIRHYEATCFTYIGEMLRYLLNQPVSERDREHRVARISGNGLRASLWLEFKDRFGVERIHEYYGASEGTNSFMNIFNYDCTIGWSPGGWVIVDYDADAGEPRRGTDGWMTKLGAGESGLLLTAVDAEHPFDGYTDAEASEKKLVRNVFSDGDCWFNTGDLIKSLGAGHAQFVDRTGDTFRWGGENVATTEVEAVINAWPQVEDAVVYGVSLPDCEGRCGMVSLTLRPGAELDYPAFTAMLRNRLPKYAVPRFLRIQQAQHLTETFKHYKVNLKKQGYSGAGDAGPVLYLTPDSEAWAPVTPAVEDAISRGRIRF